MMGRPEVILLFTGAAGASALAMMLLNKLISPPRFAQILAGGLAGLGLVWLALTMGSAGHG